ncbi:MAG TPA: N-acetylmuramoyl-L-alanine amidase [Terriglobales bacterium]|nr:N-acetylmuramoyl-L-alanine amidase [Terriglobales bacterium]
MSANPTRVDWELSATDPGSPLQEGNRVLESIARQEALRSLLAFSELHEQIRNRRLVTGRSADQDLFETERFILDEVLQLICTRAQAITQADGIIVALAAQTEGPTPEMVCHATAGPLAVERGVRLIAESRFLQECVETGRILRCDDCDTDPRVENDLAYQMGVRSTVLVPLRGRRSQVGVIQAFSTAARAFTDEDIRCFDLFSELVLAALKPEDQDRRINWLSEVAGEVLKTKPAVIAVIAVIDNDEDDAPTVEAAPPLEAAAATVAAPPLAPVAVADTDLIPPAFTTLPKFETTIAPVVINAAMVELPAELPETKDPRSSLATRNTAEPVANVDDEDEDQPLKYETFAFQPFDFDDTGSHATVPSPEVLTEDLSEALPETLPFLQRLSPANSRPWLNAAMGAAAVVLVSAAAWWGVQVHRKVEAARAEVAKIQLAQPPSVTAPAPPADVLSPSANDSAVNDNLMSPSKLDADSAPLTAATPDKLAALPKITGVRHWTSTIGSTVVIDMQDQVPYEVHRLMKPERIYFDLHDTALAAELDGKTMDVGDTSLTRVRVAQPVAGVTRIVLDTKDGSNFSVSMESNPYRLVVELRSSGSNVNALASNRMPAKTTIPSEPAAATTQKAPSAGALTATTSDQALPARTGKFRIVLDAGHGGWDLGTVGREGLLEKDLVLDVTQRLGKLLQSRLGFDVMFTRTTDNYLPLDQRADLANLAQADLFVSVHANYSSSASARGVETYFTNRFAAPGSREVEKQESDKHDDGTATKLTPVSLSAGGLREKTQESQRLAASVQRSLYATLASNSPDIRNRGIKDASFAVLMGTVMPAILTEISFVSSPTDERNLQNAAYRQQIAEALYKGIARYQEAAPRSKLAQLQTASARR